MVLSLAHPVPVRHLLLTCSHFVSVCVEFRHSFWLLLRANATTVTVVIELVDSSYQCLPVLPITSISWTFTHLTFPTSIPWATMTPVMQRRFLCLHRNLVPFLHSSSFKHLTSHWKKNSLLTVAYMKLMGVSVLPKIICPSISLVQASTKKCPSLKICTIP